MGTKTRVPTSDFSVELTPSSGDDNFAMVDEYPDINDLDYVGNGSSNVLLQDKYGFTAFDVPAGNTTTDVSIYLRGKNSGNYGASEFLGALLVVGGTTYTQYAAWTTSFTEQIFTWETDPSTELPWTVNGVNSIDYFGITTNTTAEKYVRASRIYIETNYDEVPTRALPLFLPNL